MADAATEGLAGLRIGPSTPAASKVKRPSHVRSVWSGKGEKTSMKKTGSKKHVSQADLDEMFESARESATADEFLEQKTSLATGSKVRELSDAELLFHTHLLSILDGNRFKLDEDRNMPRNAKDAICLSHSLHNKWVSVPD